MVPRGLRRWMNEANGSTTNIPASAVRPSSIGKRMPQRSARLMSISRPIPASSSRVRRNTRRVRWPPESVTSRSSTTGANTSTGPLRLPGTRENPTQGAPASAKRHCRSTCNAELRAPVSSLARMRGKPSPGSAAHSRQPTSVIAIPALRKQEGRPPSRKPPCHAFVLERVKGIEPSSVAWEATALPLSYTRGIGLAARGKSMSRAAEVATHAARADVADGLRTCR